LQRRMLVSIMHSVMMVAAWRSSTRSLGVLVRLVIDCSARVTVHCARLQQLYCGVVVLGYELWCNSSGKCRDRRRSMGATDRKQRTAQHSTRCLTAGE
jgi:hypothetical protein